MSAHFCSWTCLRIAAALTDAVFRQQRDTAGRKDRCATCLVAWIGCRLLGSLGSLVERARILLAYREDPSFFAVDRRWGFSDGPALRRARRGRRPDGRARRSPASRSGTDDHARSQGLAGVVGMPETIPTNCGRRGFSPAMPASADRCSRDMRALPVWRRCAKSSPDFAEKMAEVLCVYRQVKILKEAAKAAKKKPSKAVAIISYDEKPGIQAIAP